MLENLFSRKNEGKPAIPMDGAISANGSKLAVVLGHGLMAASITLTEYELAIDDASMALGRLNMDDPKEAARFAEHRRELFSTLDALNKDIGGLMAALDRLSLHVARGPFVEQKSKTEA